MFCDINSVCFSYLHVEIASFVAQNLSKREGANTPDYFVFC